MSCPVMVFVRSCCSNICTWSMVWLPNVSSDPNPSCMYSAIAMVASVEQCLRLRFYSNNILCKAFVRCCIQLLS
jgi:hypothetical protein